MASGKYLQFLRGAMLQQEAAGHPSTGLEEWRKPSKTTLALALCLPMMMTACGGGGGGDEPAATITEDQVSSAKVTTGSFINVDLDINNSDTTVGDNNSADKAQLIAAPLKVAGYVNVASSGADGHLRDAGDDRDFYRIVLSADEAIAVDIADSADADIDIFLFRPDGVLVDDSSSAASTEVVFAPTDGEYILQVFALRGASNYVLRAEGENRRDASSAAAQHGYRAVLPTSQREVLLQFDPVQLEDVLNTGRSDLGDLLAQDFNLLQLAGSGNRIRLFAAETDAALDAALSALGDNTGRLDLGSTELNRRYQTIRLAKGLQRLTSVLTATPNLLRFPSAIPNDPSYSGQWHYQQINLPEAWNVTTGDATVRVAVLDGGILPNHPDLAPNIVAIDPDGYDFVQSIESSGDGDGIDDDATDPGNPDPEQTEFHGSHVAGTIAAATNNDRDVAGACWDCRIYPLRVLGTDSGTSYDLIQALYFAAGAENDSGRRMIPPAQVINMSLGAEGFSPLEEAAINQALNVGAVIVAAIGNDAGTDIQFPAGYDGVIAVSATTSNGAHASYSNQNAAVDVAAPGGSGALGVLSTAGDTVGDAVVYRSERLFGTSMATPHVAGVAALMRSAYSGMSPDEFVRLLEGGFITDDLGAEGRDDRYGYGLINAEKAVTIAADLAAGGEFPQAARLEVTPNRLNFGLSLDALETRLQNTGDADLQIDGIDSSQSWLSFAQAAPVSADGTGRWIATVERSQLASGTHETTATVRSSAGSKNITVQVLVANGAFDGGLHYVQLYDVDNDQLVFEGSIIADGQAVTLNVTDLPTGDYLLVAGTDNDNDGLLCDAGELCSLFPGREADQIVSVSSGEADITIITDTVSFGASQGRRYQRQ